MKNNIMNNPILLCLSGSSNPVHTQQTAFEVETFAQSWMNQTF